MKQCGPYTALKKCKMSIPRAQRRLNPKPQDGTPVHGREQTVFKQIQLLHPNSDVEILMKKSENISAAFNAYIDCVDELKPNFRHYESDI